MKKHPRKSVSNHKKTCDDGLILNKRSQKLLGKLLADSHAGRNMVGPFYTAEEMIKSLKS